MPIQRHGDPAETLNSVVHRITDGLTDTSTLDPARLTVLARMTFLADWKSAIETGETITRVTWELTQYAPDFMRFADEVRATGATVDFTRDEDGFPGKVKLAPKPVDLLTPPQVAAVEHVVEIGQQVPPSELQRLVESTHPMLAAEVGILQIPMLAEEYNTQYRLPKAS